MTRWQVAALFGLSLLTSSAWLVNDALPPVLPPIAGEGVRLLLMGLLGLPFLVVQRRALSLPAFGMAGLIGFALIGLPFLLLQAAAGRVGSATVVLVFALMPLTISLLQGSLLQGAGGPLGSSLLGVAGVLVLLPVRAPSSSEAVFGLACGVAAMLLTAGCMIGLRPRLTQIPLGSAFAWICLFNGLLLIAASFALRDGGWELDGVGVECVRCLLFDLPQVLLLLWLVKTVPATRLSARYLIAPLFTVTEGMVFLRPHPDGRTLIGIVLLGIGAYLTLRGGSMNENLSLGLKRATPDDLRR